MCEKNLHLNVKHYLSSQNNVNHSDYVNFHIFIDYLKKHHVWLEIQHIQKNFNTSQIQSSLNSKIKSSEIVFKNQLKFARSRFVVVSYFS